ncbi:methylcobamide:CoM methyltransferase MtaA [Methanolobus halotolerans]|uniref:Methylcobamide--CoM methyltransferase n=1 Tax=Methanolobus halotolerans TaxID=2052935 RepID=A0A4E0Q9X2_9EURY|nr:methylcobamide:CoM methyltransferase MtaA [Methanolobus halotolerans]TGC09102.1 methylcobamide--CoM methyltransferase [Methanolobus halotolerans]
MINEPEITLRKKFRDILDRKYVGAPLVGTVTTAGLLELMDITGAIRPEADRDPKKMVKLAGSLHTVANFEVIRYPFDVTVLGEAMGCNIDPGTKARTPAIVSHPFEDNPEAIDVPPDLPGRGRIPVILEVSKLLRSKEGEEIPIVAGLEGPADLASYLCGMRYFLKWTIQKPQLAREIVDKCIDICILYANALIDSGADAVVIADATASPDIMGPDAFIEFIKPGLIRFTDSVDGHCIIHVCGKTDSIIPDLLDCGFNAISVEESVEDLSRIVDLAHKKNTAVIGNISTSITLFSKTADDVREESMICLEKGVDILAPGCGIAPESPLKNLLAMVEARDEYSYSEQGQ